MIQFTERCEAAIRNHDLQKFHGQLKLQLESYTTVDIDADMAHDTGAHVLELKLKALIFDTIHNIEVVEQLMDSKLNDVNDWPWQKQLRYAPMFSTVLIFASIIK